VPAAAAAAVVGGGNKRHGDGSVRRRRLLALDRLLRGRSFVRPSVAGSRARPLTIDARPQHARPPAARRYDI